MSQTPTIVLGSGMTTVGALRTLHRAGVPTYAYDRHPSLERHSRWYRPLPLRRAVDADDLGDVLGGAGISSAVLIPCSDTWAHRVASLRPDLRSRFRASIATPGTIAQLVDKARFAQLLRHLGVPHPVTRTLSGVAGLASIPDAALEGAFLKPLQSQPFFARFGVKAFRIASRAEAVARMQEVEAAGLEVMLQEYVPGAGSRHYYVEGLVDAKGTLHGPFARRRLRMHPPDFGNSSAMISVAAGEVAPAIASVRTLLGHLGYRGIFSAEFKRDPRDDRFQLIEVNARAWWYVEFAARCGIDVCTMAYRDALGLDVAAPTAYRVGARMVYPYYDLPAVRAARRAGDLTMLGWARSWIGAQQPLFNWSDPMPAVQELLGGAHRRIRRGTVG